jgi:hypothetical protein
MDGTSTRDTGLLPDAARMDSDAEDSTCTGFANLATITHRPDIRMKVRRVIRSKRHAKPIPRPDEPDEPNRPDYLRRKKKPLLMAVDGIEKRIIQDPLRRLLESALNLQFAQTDGSSEYGWEQIGAFAI